MGVIMGQLSRALATLAIALGLAAPSLAQPFTDLDGDWQARVSKKDKGAAALTFGAPMGGAFTVEGTGMTLGLAEFFVVSPGQTLLRDSSDVFAGSVLIEDEAGGALGSLEIEGGKVTKNLEKWKAGGLRRPVVGEDLKIGLKAVRAPAAGSVPQVQGKSTRANVSGGGLKSKTYEATVDFDPAGYPVFMFDGSGPIKVDGVEIADVVMNGRIILDDKQRLYGSFDSPMLGAGVMQGKLRESKKTGIPQLKLKVTTAARKFNIKANLDKAVSPILTVSPTSGAFGKAPIGLPAEIAFNVSNTGVGLLVGSATLEGADPEFTLADATGTIVGQVDYALAENENTTVRVFFTPDDTQNSGGTLKLTQSSGGGTEIALSGNGVAIAVTPGVGQAFGDVEVGMSSDLEFTVTNIGSGNLNGEATLANGEPDFTLLDNGDNPTASVGYNLSPAESKVVKVRFAPQSEGPKTGQVAFSGGGGLVRPLSGNATAASAP